MKYGTMEIVVAPLAKHRLAVIADMLYNINIAHGRGCIAEVKIDSAASGRVSGRIVREIVNAVGFISKDEQKFTVRNNIIRCMGHRLDLPK